MGDDEQKSLVVGDSEIISSAKDKYLILNELASRMAVLIDNLDKELIRKRLKEETDNYVKFVIKRTKLRLRKVQDWAGILGFITGMLVFLIPRFTTIIDPIGTVTMSLISITILCIFIAYRFNTFARDIGDTIEDILLTLDNRDFLQKLYKDINLESYSGAHFEKFQVGLKLEGWLKRRKELLIEANERDQIERVVRKIGEQDFAGILLRKGIEKQLINEQHMDSGLFIYYLYPKDK